MGFVFDSGRPVDGNGYGPRAVLESRFVAVGRADDDGILTITPIIFNVPRRIVESVTEVISLLCIGPRDSTSIHQHLDNEPLKKVGLNGWNRTRRPNPNLGAHPV